MTRKHPTELTIKRLFSRSGNRCAFPDCNQIIATDEGHLVGEVCHIEAASKGGERYNPQQSEDERASFENLIILCRNHHAVTNDTVKYTVDVLRKMKADHEVKFSRQSYEVPQNILSEAIAQYNETINRVEENTEEILAINRKLLEKIESGKFLVQTEQEVLLPNIAIAKILRKAEAENHGIKFSISNLDTDGNVTIKLIPTPEADNLNIGKVIFPNTQAGQSGKIKFISAMEKGESVHLEADEYIWESSITFPVIGNPPLQSGGLSFSREIPNITIPVRLEIAPEGQSPVAVNMTNMTIIRFGTQEVEFLLKGGQLIGEMTLVSNLKSDKTILTYTGVYPSTINAVQAKKSYLMHSAFLRESNFKIISLENEKIILEDLGSEINSNLNTDYFDKAIRFLDILIKINQELGIDLRLPESIDPDTFSSALYLENVFANGKLFESRRGEVSYTYEKSKAFSFIEVMKDMYSVETKSSQTLRMRHEVSFDFLEQKIFLGEAILIFTNVLLAKSIQEIEQEISLLSDGEEIDILIKYDKAIRYFPKWFSDKNDEYAEMVIQQL